MVRYFTEDIDFTFKYRRLNTSWYKFLSGTEMKKLGDINVIFCSDNYLLNINMKYLQHDYFTDIITFDYCEGNILSGDLFISVDSVRENSLFYGVEFDNELNRVLIHGILHLAGYDDHSEEEIALMRSKENYYLEQRCKLATM